MRAHLDCRTRPAPFARLRSALALATLTVAVAACGGGGSSSAPAAMAVPATEGTVPAQASSSVAGLIAWASTVARSDTAEPVNTDAFHPPVDDSAEPIAVP